MKASLEFKHASKLTSEELTAIRPLKLADIGVIWDDFIDHRHDDDCFVILCKTPRTLCGWGLLFYKEFESEWVFSVFVKKHFRRKGYGSRIYRFAKRRKKLCHNEIKVYRHDDRSTAFFDQLQTRI